MLKKITNESDPTAKKYFFQNSKLVNVKKKHSGDFVNSIY